MDDKEKKDFQKDHQALLGRASASIQHQLMSKVLEGAKSWRQSRLSCRRPWHMWTCASGGQGVNDVNG